MAHLNIEFKARKNNIAALENKLLSLNPRFVGIDHQKDTYFNVPKGRLKLREGNIENALIYYERKDNAGVKRSDVTLYSHPADAALKDILIKAYGIKKVVDKKRKIYFIENVKFHFDEVAGLGTFVEVEAIDQDGTHTPLSLQKQCDEYARLFDISNEDYISNSYSDMI